MKVTFNISEDEQLKKEITSLVRGELKALVREEFSEIVKEEIKRKVVSLKVSQPEFQEIMKKAIKEILHKEYNVSDWGIDYITKTIIAQVEKHASYALEQQHYQRKIDKTIDDIVKQKITNLIEKI